ncbi:MAG: hypothetical protein GC160_28825 [Acidobacteria bacterium]|nr:hypothetical protein [Acidobacteriota bacterium]
MLGPRNDGIRVLIAHPQALVRAALTALMADTTDLIAADEAASYADLLTKLGPVAPQAALVSLQLLEPPPFRKIAELLQRRPEIRIVALSQGEPVDDQVAAVRGGASAIVGQRTPGPKLCEAIRSVSRGLRWYDPAVERYMDERRTTTLPAGDLTSLTPRERQIAALVARGEPYRRIASELQISGHTVKNHVRHIFDKLDVNSRVELALLAAESQN